MVKKNVIHDVLVFITYFFPYLFVTNILGIKVNRGICTYPFDFILPPHAPSSFKSSIATVKYFIQITSKTSCNMPKRKIFPMCVLGKINVNHFEEYKVKKCCYILEIQTTRQI